MAAEPSNPEVAAGKTFTESPKVVFSKTFDSSKWANTVVAQGDWVEAITKLKQAEGKDIIAYGGATFVSALIKAGLIDDLHLFINLAAIGSGMSIFQELAHKQALALVKATHLRVGLLCCITHQSAINVVCKSVWQCGNSATLPH